MRAILFLMAVLTLPFLALGQTTGPRLDIGLSSTNTAAVSWTGRPGTIYNLQRVTNFPPAWRSLNGSQQGASSYLATDTLGQPRAFYRLVSIERIIQLVSTNANETVHLRPNELLQITLSANPSTGFQWAIASGTSQTLNLAKFTFIATPGVGTPGNAIFLFEPISFGQQNLQLEYRRFSGTPVDTFSITVITDP
jgi:predicted secreted protein